jgi:hypothetical protein
MRQKLHRKRKSSDSKSVNFIMSPTAAATMLLTPESPGPQSVLGYSTYPIDTVRSPTQTTMSPLEMSFAHQLSPRGTLNFHRQNQQGPMTTNQVMNALLSACIGTNLVSKKLHDGGKVLMKIEDIKVRMAKRPAVGLGIVDQPSHYFAGRRMLSLFVKRTLKRTRVPRWYRNCCGKCTAVQ